jgi:hypothetical protein
MHSKIVSKFCLAFSSSVAVRFGQRQMTMYLVDGQSVLRRVYDLDRDSKCNCRMYGADLDTRHPGGFHASCSC